MTEHVKSSRKDILVYTRVSTTKQDEEGYSSQKQLDAANAYARYKKLIGSNEEIAPEFIINEPEPASKPIGSKRTATSILGALKHQRPELSRIVSLALDKQFSHLIVFSRDRLCRDVQEYLTLSLLFRQSSVTLHFSRPGEFEGQDENKTNRFIDIILASLAELESNTISSRVKSITAHCVQQGYWPGGKAPLGYRIAENLESKKKKRLEIFNSYRKEKIQEVYRYYNFYGYSYKKIAGIMREKYPDKYGRTDREVWTESKVEGIINNETYTGRITWNRRGGRRDPGKRDDHIQSDLREEISIIEEPLWKNTEDIRHKKSKTADPRYYNTSYLLKGKLVCGECQSKLKTKNYGKGKKSVYRCPNADENGISHIILEKSAVEAQFFDKLDGLFDLENTDNLWYEYNQLIQTRIDDQKNSIDTLNNELAKCNEIINRTESVLRTNINNIMKDLLRQQLVKFKRDLSAIKNQIEILNQSQITPIDHIEQFKLAIKKVWAMVPASDNTPLHEAIDNIGNETRRVFIDLLVDSIIIKDIDGTIQLNIVINPPKWL